MRERVAPCCQQGFWEILPAFIAGEIYSLLGVGDRRRAWEKGYTCSSIWDEKAPACCSEGGRVLWMSRDHMDWNEWDHMEGHS